MTAELHDWRRVEVIERFESTPNVIVCIIGVGRLVFDSCKPRNERHTQQTSQYLTVITCSTVVLECYRRQAITMEQAKIRPSVTLYSLDRSLPNLGMVDYVGDPYSYANFR